MDIIGTASEINSSKAGIGRCVIVLMCILCQNMPCWARFGNVPSLHSNITVNSQIEPYIKHRLHIDTVYIWYICCPCCMMKEHHRCLKRE